MNEPAQEFFRKKREEDLRNAGIDPQDEASLINAIPATEDFYLLKHITIALQEYGTEAAIPALKKLLFYPKQDIKITSFEALVNILGSEGQDFYVECLNNSKIRDKFGAMLAIRRYCDERACESVIARLKKIMAGQRKAVYYSGELTELTAALDYLNKGGSAHRDAAFDLVRQAVEKIEKREHEWIALNVPELLKSGAEGVAPQSQRIGQQDAGGKGDKRSWFASLWKR